MTNVQRVGIVVGAVLLVGVLLALVGLRGKFFGSGEAGGSGDGAGGAEVFARVVAGRDSGMTEPARRGASSRMRSGGTTVPVITMAGKPVLESADKMTTYARNWVSGLVRTVGGVPLPNVDVVAVLSGGEKEPLVSVAQSVSGSDGRFTMDLPRGVRINIVGRAAGFGLSTVYAGGVHSLPPSDSENSIVELVMYPTYQVEGLVTDTRGAPVEGVRLQLISIRNHPESVVELTPQVSDINGRFRVMDACGLGVMAQASKEGFQRTVSEVAAGSKEWRVRMEAGGAKISGRVVNGVTSSPVAGLSFNFRTIIQSGVGRAQVPLWIMMVTDQAGQFDTGWLPPGLYGRGVKPGQEWEFRSVSQIETYGSAGLQVGEGGMVGLELVAHRIPRVRGRVLDRNSGRPIEGVQVRAAAVPLHVEQMTGADGGFDLLLEETYLEEKSPGKVVRRFAFQVVADGYILMAPDNFALDDVYGFEAPPDELIVHKDVLMAPIATVSGRVFLRDGRTSGGFEVKVDSRRRDQGGRDEVKCEADGSYRLRVAAPTEGFRVSARGLGYEGYSVILSVKPGEELTADVRERDPAVREPGMPVRF